MTVDGFFLYLVPVEPKILSSNKDIKDFKSTTHDLVIGDSLETLVGTTVYIRCPATGNPAPLIEWEKSGFPVIETSSLQIVNSTLILLESTWSDTGNYACSASSGAGYDQKTTFLKFMGAFLNVGNVPFRQSKSGCCHKNSIFCSICLR